MFFLFLQIKIKMATWDGELLENVFSVFAKKIRMTTWDGELLEMLER